MRTGHKTGFYLDQRENREIIGNWFRWDGRRQSVKCSTPSPTPVLCRLRARRPGPACGQRGYLSGGSLARRNIALNGYALDDDDFVEGMSSRCCATARPGAALRHDHPRPAEIRALGAPGRKQRAATRTSICWPSSFYGGGVLATFSCSGAISMTCSRRSCRGGGRRCDAQIVRWLAQASDPGRANFPEGPI